MSYGAVYARALGRAALVACAAVPMGAAMAAFLRVPRPRGRRMLVWASLLLPFVTPALLVGYGYASFSLSLVRHPLWNQALYTVLVWLKVVPPAALVLYFAPSLFTPQAMHCRRLLDGGHGTRSRLTSRLGFLARGPGRKWLVAFGVAFLLAFGEFEIASLMVVPTWTVRIFDAQAGGLALLDSLRLVSLPAISEAVVVFVVLLALVHARRLAGLRSKRAHPGRTVRWTSLGYVVLAVTCVTLVPGWVVLKGAVAGLPLLLRDFSLGSDLLHSIAYGAVAAGIGYVAAGWFIRGRGTSRLAGTRTLLGALLAVPGLLGGLVLALVAVYLCQQPVLQAVYDTPLPLLTTLAMLLFPFALLLRLLVQRFRPDAALHTASLLTGSGSPPVRGRGRRLRWRLDVRARFWVFFLLFCWAYLELSASAILAPPGHTTAVVWLYNLMHYGRSQVLSAMVLVALLVPLLVVLIVEAFRSSAVRLMTHA
ncbi:MAG: hypothetical protein R6X33_17595 [Candidatus Brocadiia bacterium]